MTDEIERRDGEIRLWLWRGVRLMWLAEPGRKPCGSCFLQHYTDGEWRSVPLGDWTTHPAPRWPL